MHQDLYLNASRLKAIRKDPEVRLDAADVRLVVLSELKHSHQRASGAFARLVVLGSVSAIERPVLRIPELDVVQDCAEDPSLHVGQDTERPTGHGLVCR